MPPTQTCGVAGPHTTATKRPTFYQLNTSGDRAQTNNVDVVSKPNLYSSADVFPVGGITMVHISSESGAAQKRLFWIKVPPHNDSLNDPGRKHSTVLPIIILYYYNVALLYLRGFVSLFYRWLISPECSHKAKYTFSVVFFALSPYSISSCLIQ